MGRVVALAEILAENFRHRNSDFIEVNTVWSNAPPLKGSPSRFIFADKDGSHIGAVLYFENISSANVYQKLKETKRRFRIRNFGIQYNTKYPIIKTQSKRICLAQGTLNIEDCGPSTETFTQHIPFDFTNLKDIDNCPVDSIIDIIGLAKDKEMIKWPVTGSDCLKVAMYSSKHKNEGVVREVNLFGDHIKSLTKKGEIYAVMNVRVKEFDGNKTLQSTANTIAVKLTHANLHLMSKQYQEDQEISDLFPIRRTSRKSDESLFQTENSKELTPSTKRGRLDTTNPLSVNNF